MEYKNVIRTKASIKQAFYDLVEEKGDVKKISVKDLVEKAGISKSTFYTHYKDLNGVLVEFENEAITTTINQIREYFKDLNHSPDQYVHELFNLFKKNESLYKKLFKCNADFNFLDRMFDHTYNELYKYMSAKYTPESAIGLKYEISFITYGTISMLFNYFIGRLEFSLDEIEDKTVQLFIGVSKEVEMLSQKQKKKKA